MSDLHWFLGPPPRLADDVHYHVCSVCHRDHACGMNCSEHPERGPLYGVPTPCSPCAEARDFQVVVSEDGESEEIWFTCEVCLGLTHADDGAADDLPRCCSDCWAAFHEEVLRG